MGHKRRERKVTLVLKNKEKKVLKPNQNEPACSLHTDALQLQLPSQRHEPCISQSHSVLFSADESHPHAASVILGRSHAGF